MHVLKCNQSFWVVRYIQMVSCIGPLIWIFRDTLSPFFVFQVVRLNGDVFV